MKVVELLKIGGEMLKLMSRNGILRDDFEYVEAYEHYRRMRALGMKSDAAFEELVNDYGVAKRTLQRAFKRLAQDC